MRISQKTIDEIGAVSDARERERKQRELERASSIMVLDADGQILSTHGRASQLRVILFRPDGSTDQVWAGSEAEGDPY